MSDLLSLVLIFSVALLVYGLRGRIVGALRRFDARNAQRRAEEFRALTDRNAHYRQTVALAEEQIEAVSKVSVPDARTAEPVTRYVFLGSQYASRDEAEAVRRAVVIEKAREFYIDLDRIYLSRRGRRPPPFAAPLLTDASKHETYTPPKMEP